MIDETIARLRKDWPAYQDLERLITAYETQAEVWDKTMADASVLMDGLRLRAERAEKDLVEARQHLEALMTATLYCSGSCMSGPGRDARRAARAFLFRT